MAPEYFESLRPLMKRATTLGNNIEVDPVDSDLLIYTWSESGDGHPSNSINGKFVYMHRIIMERIVGRELGGRELVDHIDGDSRNNCRSNLRIATESQNRMNSKDRKRQSNYRGVYFDKLRAATKPWKAVIHVDGRQKCLGYFRNEEEAAVARDAAAKQHYGEFARLNNV